MRQYTLVFELDPLVERGDLTTMNNELFSLGRIGNDRCVAGVLLRRDR